MIENKKVITRSLVVLFLSLSIVYSLTYQKKESLFKANLWNEIANQTWTENQNLWSTSQDSTIANTENSKEKKIGEISLWGLEKSSWVSNSNIQTPRAESDGSVSLGSTRTGLLPGTTEYFGTLDIVSILWETPKYTLQDSRWNYFAYYGDHLDFVKTVQTLGGNVYEMVTEKEILQNQLFGDRVSYINLSMFKDIRVLMVIEIDGDVWLLQIPVDKYHNSKDYLKSLFIQ